MALDEDWITDMHFSELSNGVTLLLMISGSAYLLAWQRL
jgi:hypothetical protein